MRLGVLLTGGGGRIGRRLVSRLLSNGHGVVALDRAHEGYPDNSGVISIKGDLTDERACDISFSALSDLEADRKAVVHLAAIGSVMSARSNPAAAVRDNIVATSNILSATARHDVKRFVIASSSLVYGRYGPKPLKENLKPAPDSVYAATKLASESIARGFAADYGMSCEIARLSNVYGPDSPEGTVVGRIIHQIRRGHEIQIESRTPVRDFIFVDDAAEALYRLLTVTDRKGCWITNVSSGVGTSIGALIDMALSIVGRPTIQGRVEEKTRDCLILSSELLRRRTGWSPEYSLHDGLSACLKK